MRLSTAAGDAKVEFPDPHVAAGPVEGEVTSACASLPARGDGR